MFGVQEGAVGSQEVAGKWRCMNDFSQKVEDFSRFFEIGSFRPWRRRRWSRLAERSPKPVSPTKTDKGKRVSDDTRKIRRFSRRTCRPGHWPVTPPGPQAKLYSTQSEHAQLNTHIQLRIPLIRVSRRPSSTPASVPLTHVCATRRLSALHLLAVLPLLRPRTPPKDRRARAAAPSSRRPSKNGFA